MSHQLLILLFLTFLSLSHSTTAYTTIRCSPATYTDPYPAVPPQIATSTSSHFYAVSSPSLATVTIHTASATAYNASTSTSFTSVPSPCFNGSIAGTTVAFSPDYGRAIDLQADVLAIGAPSRGFNDGSFIDLIPLSVTASGSIDTANHQSLYSPTSPTLGLTLSLSSDATYLAAYYDADQLVVFHPVLIPARSQPQYNTAQPDADLLVPYPAAFYVDSMQLSLPYLLVSGVMADSGAAMQPTVLVYEGIGWPGTVTAWMLQPTSPITLSAAAAGLVLGYPARSLPVAASVVDGTAVIAVGCPSQQTVYTTQSSSAIVGALESDPTSSFLTTFGTAVAVSNDGKTTFVLATEGMLVFSTASLLTSNASEAVNVVDVAESILPNRQQHSGSTYSSYSSLAVSNNVTLVLPTTSTTPLLVPFVSASLTFDSTLDTFVACPAGSYRPATTTASLSPCLFCPVGAYSSTTGSSSCINCTADEYCPAGSTYPYDATDISEEPESTIPEFETESFEESFEDLLINGIFSPTTVPMIIAFVIAGVTLLTVVLYVLLRREWLLRVLKLYRFALMPDEEEEREKELEVKNLLDELLDEREKHAPRCPHAIVPSTPTAHSRHPSAPGGAAHHSQHEHEHGNEGEHAQGESGPARPKDQAYEAERKVVEESRMRESAMKGFFNLLLLLFAVSCIVFSWTYLNNYRPDDTGSSEDNNRYRTETLYSVTISDPIQLEGLNAINSVNATIFTHLIGYSGMACERTALQQLALDGCIIQQSNQLCNQSSFWDVYDNEELPNTCTIEFRLVQGTLLALMAVLHLYLPASLQVQALRYVFQQDAQDSAPQEHITTGTTTFWDTATHPTDADNNLYPNALASYVQRDWVFGILAQSQQIDENQPPTFAYEWYNTVTSLNTGWLPTTPLTDYTHGQAAYTELVLTMQTETFFRLQQTQKLIEMKAAFLTILLGLIAIFHIIEFAKQLFEVFLIALKKVKKNQALAKVGKVTQARLNQVVDAGMGVGKEVLHLAGHSRQNSPLTLTRSAGRKEEREREEKQPLSGRSSPYNMMHSSRYIDTPPPPINAHYSAEVHEVHVPTQPLFPPVSYHTASLPPLSHPPPVSSYGPNEYGGNNGGSFPSLPASQLPYPISSLPMATGSGSHSRHASYNPSVAVGGGGAVAASRFEI